MWDEQLQSKSALEAGQDHTETTLSMCLSCSNASLSSLAARPPSVSLGLGQAPVPESHEESCTLWRGAPR